MEIELLWYLPRDRWNSISLTRPSCVRLHGGLRNACQPPVSQTDGHLIAAARACEIVSAPLRQHAVASVRRRWRSPARVSAPPQRHVRAVQHLRQRRRAQVAGAHSQEDDSHRGYGECSLSSIVRSTDRTFVLERNPITGEVKPPRTPQHSAQSNGVGHSAHKGGNGHTNGQANGHHCNGHEQNGPNRTRIPPGGFSNGII